MKPLEKLISNIETKKDGIYKSYYLNKSNELSKNQSEIVFAYNNPRATGYITQDGINHIVYIPKEFFNKKSSIKSIYVGETQKYTGEESGYLHELYETTIGQIIKAIRKKDVDILKIKKKNKEKAEKAKVVKEEWQKNFDAAKPDDLINSGFGYMVKKRNYHIAQKHGYDGIES
jgi:hypothetical protein